MRLQLSNRLLPSAILSVVSWLYSLTGITTTSPVLFCMLKGILHGLESNLIRNKVLGTVGMINDDSHTQIGNRDIRNKVRAKSASKCGTSPRQREVSTLVRGKIDNAVRKGRFYARKMRHQECRKEKVSTILTIAQKTGYRMRVAVSSL